MNIEDIETKLPSGFHDAKLLKISIDYLTRKAILTLSVSIAEPDKAEIKSSGTYKNGILELNGLLFLSIDPPEADYPFAEKKGVWVDSGSADSLNQKKLQTLIDALPEDAFVHYFFAQDWNSFIFISAIDAKFTWV